MADETMIFLFSIMVGVKNYLMDGLTLSAILSALLKVLSESNNCNWGQCRPLSVLFYFVPQDSHSQAGSTRSMAIIVDLSEVAFFYTQVNYL